MKNNNKGNDDDKKCLTWPLKKCTKNCGFFSAAVAVDGRLSSAVCFTHSQKSKASFIFNDIK